MQEALQYYLSNNSTALECSKKFNCDRKKLIKEVKNICINYKTVKFIHTANKIHNYKYDYSLVKTINSVHENVDIICPTHGTFNQNIFVHTKGHGCSKCGRTIFKQLRTYTKEKFIIKAQKVHNNLYSYKDVMYLNTKTKIEITCNLHGNFLQIPSDHLQGKGCSFCAKENVGWSITKWKNKGKDKLAKVYIIKCWDENESFLKIGRTFNTVKRRFGTYRDLPYNWVIVKTFESKNYEEIWDKERYFHRKYKDFKHIPLKTFQGKTECFSIKLLNEIETAWN
jgi:hypothetical protein